MRLIYGISAGLLGFALTAQSAGAQNMPDMNAPAFSWSGIYIGAHAGSGWGRTKHCDEPDDACTPSFDIDGLLTGGTVGLTWQYANWAFGIEADRSFGEIKGSVPTSLQFNCGAPCFTEVRRFATVRGRLGATFDRLFVYGTGGYAFGEVFGEVAGVANRVRKSGWTAGLGIEIALMPQISAKLEYLHVHLGSILSDPTGPYTTYGNFDLVRVGLN